MCSSDLTNCIVGASFMHKAEIEQRDDIGVDHLLFGRDYPHGEGTWPNTRAMLDDLFVGVSEADTRAILGENAIRFFGLDGAAIDAVEAAVRGYARAEGADEIEWGVVALLHDFDYERWPSLDEHPYKGSEILRERDYPEWVRRAILSHADYTGVTRDSQLEKTLFACDEMAGFVTAASLVRPSRSILDLEAASVIKRMKDKAFARAVSRDDLRAGAELLGLPLDQHIGNVIRFMREQADALGLRGSL